VALVEHLRSVHLDMVGAVLGGHGLERVAELAGEAAGAPVAIVVPRLGVAVGAAEYLSLAAVASLTELALVDARDEVERTVRGSFLEDLRGRRQRFR